MKRCWPCLLTCLHRGILPQFTKTTRLLRWKTIVGNKHRFQNDAVVESTPGPLLGARSREGLASISGPTCFLRCDGLVLNGGNATAQGGVIKLRAR